MHRVLTLAALLVVFAVTVARAQPNPPDLSAVPDVIKSLKWKDIDPGSLPMVEQCRALQLLNDSLDEISASGRAQADLMSTFIDQQKLGPDFVASQPPPDPAPLTYDDATKITVALLRGPLAQSPYASQFAGNSEPGFLKAYDRLFQTTCRRKWGEVAESRHQTMWMTAFLQSRNLMPQYEAWAPAEIQRRQQEHEQQMILRSAANRASEAAQEQRAAEIDKQHDQQQAQKQAQQAKAQSQQQAAAQPMQQALTSAQQAQLQADMSSGAPAVYAGGYYGGAAALASADLYRDAAYRGASSAAVEQRYSNWHGAGRR